MIHQTAIIHPKACIAEEVEIGPYAVIGEGVSIGKGTVIGASTVIEGPTEIGEYNQISQLVAIGAPPQDLKYKGEPTTLKIGNRNVIREFATLHRGTPTGHGETIVGDNNLLMAYCHVAHDCRLGNGIIMSNAATLAGHVSVEDMAILGGLAAIHQFCRVGAHTMIGGGTLVGTDIPPYTIATGGERRDASLRGLNLIGLKRRGFSEETIHALKKAYKMLVFSKLKVPEVIEKIRAELPPIPEVLHFAEFMEHTHRGICRR